MKSVKNLHFNRVEYTAMDVLHNEKGPAVVFDNGEVEWILMGKCISFDRWCKELNKTNEEIIQMKLMYGSPSSNTWTLKQTNSILEEMVWKKIGEISNVKEEKRKTKVC